MTTEFVEPEYKHFKISEVFAALEKNGFAHLRERWFAEDVEGVVIAACVLGQTAINLGVEATNTSGNLLHHLDTFKVTDETVWGDNITPWYDTDDDEINQENGYVPAGQLIMHWNDICDYSTGKYVLETYEEVVEKARAILTPFFEETITLRTKVWNFERKTDANA